MPRFARIDSVVRACRAVRANHLRGSEISEIPKRGRRVLNAVGCRKTQMSAKRVQTQVRKGAQKGTKKRLRAKIANTQVKNNQVWEVPRETDPPFLTSLAKMQGNPLKRQGRKGFSLTQTPQILWNDGKCSQKARKNAKERRKSTKSQESEIREWTPFFANRVSGLFCESHPVREIFQQNNQNLKTLTSVARQFGAQLLWWCWYVTRSWSLDVQFSCKRARGHQLSDTKQDILVACLSWIVSCQAQTSREQWRKDQGRQKEPTLAEKGDDEMQLDHDKSHDKNHDEIDTTNRTRIRGRNVMPFSPCVLSWFNSDPFWLCSQQLSWYCFGLQRFQQAWLQRWWR